MHMAGGELPGPEPQAGRRHPRASQGSESFPLAGYIDLVAANVHLHPGGALQLLHLGQGLYGPQIPSVAALLQTRHLQDKRWRGTLGLVVPGGQKRLLQFN